MKLIDFSRDGHHKIYQNNILKIKNTDLLVLENDLSFKKNKFNYFFEIYKIINKEKNKNIHFLTLDYIYKYPLLKKINKKRLIIGTLHKEPDNFLKKLFLHNFSKKIDTIIVHSEFMEMALKKIGISNVEVITYPSFYNYSNYNRKKLRNVKKIEDKIIISCLGGTRLDKGLDTLLNAFEYINKNLKKKIILNIAGKEEYFKKEYINEIANKFNINIIGNYKFLTNEEFIENILITDILVLPYKRFFSGNSGPMTEAIVNKIPCIAPRELEIGNMIEKYKLGLTFECENSENLAEIIEEMVKKLNDRNNVENRYLEELTIEKFINRHQEVYMSRGELK